MLTYDLNVNTLILCQGVQWLNGRVFDWRPRGGGGGGGGVGGFKPHQRHSVVVLQQDKLILA